VLKQRLISEYGLNPFNFESRGFLQYFFLFLLTLVFLAPDSVSAESEKNNLKNLSQGISFRFHLMQGWPYRVASDKLYENFKITSLGLTIEKECGLWPFFQNKKIIESLLLELRFSHIYGRGIPLGEDQMPKETWARFIQEGRKPSADWDHYQIGLTPFYRWYYPLSSDLRFFAELGLGLTYLNETLIEDGTKFNVLFTGGLGLDWKLKNHPFFIMTRFEHFCKGDGSNNFINAKRNIGPEALFIGMGIRYPL
jgi:hypothetical protein